LRGGVWYLRKNVDGKRVELSTGYSENEKRKAQAAAIKMVSNLLDQKHGLAPKPIEDSKVPTFGEWAETYEKVYSSKKSKPKRDASIIAFWRQIPIGKQMWQDVRLDQFTEAACIAALDYRRQQGTLNPNWTKQRKDVAEGTVQRERGLVQAMFESARKNRHITDNPWEGVEKEPGDVRLRLLTPEAEIAMLAVMTPQFKRFVGFLLETGLRLDECRKLEPRDVAVNGIHVHGKGRKRKSRCMECKREGGKCRNVPLTNKAKRLLQEQFEAEGAYWGQTQARLREVIQKACERAEIDHLSPHDLRHTFGHRWLQKGGDIYTLSKVLGHSSVAVTEKHYAHLLESDIDKRVRAVMEIA